MPIPALPNRIIDHIMLVRCLLPPRVLHVRKAAIDIAQIDLRHAFVEEHLSGEELELEAQLLIVDRLVAAQVDESFFEVVQREVVSPEEEVGDAALEVAGGRR